MRIVHLLQSNKFSGAENVVCQIMQAFKFDNTIEMVYLSPLGPIAEELKHRELPYRPINKFNQNEIRSALKELKPDVIQAHDFSASVRASVVPGVKVISHIHSNPLWLSKTNINTLSYAMASLRFSKVVGVSQQIYSEYKFNLLIKYKYTVIENVVDKERIEKMAQEETDRSYDLLYVGRLSVAKDPIRFLKIVKSLSESIKNLSCAMLGVGPLEKECKEFIRTNNLEKNVVMIGFDPNPYKYMRTSKMILVTSKYEGFGLVAVEAMILGTIVLANPVGGLVDIIDDNTGRLCRSDSDYHNAVLELIVNEKLSNDIKAAAKEKAELYTDRERFKLRWKEIYDSLI